MNTTFISDVLDILNVPDTNNGVLVVSAATREDASYALGRLFYECNHNEVIIHTKLTYTYDVSVDEDTVSPVMEALTEQPENRPFIVLASVNNELDNYYSGIYFPNGYNPDDEKGSLSPIFDIIQNAHGVDANELVSAVNTARERRN